MKIFRSISSNRKTQNFGANLACVSVDYNNNVILPYKVIGKTAGLCPTGYSDFYTKVLGMKGHNGEDWAVWNGEPLYFSTDARDKNGAEIKWFARSEIDIAGGVGVDVYSRDRVFFTECPKEDGDMKMIENEWKENGGWLYVKFRFWHLKETWIKNVFKPNGEYQWIKCGDYLGRCDNTGASAGSHLHWALKITNGEGHGYMTISDDNGYSGAVQFPYGTFENDYIGRVIEVKKQALNAIEMAKKLIASVLNFLGKVSAGWGTKFSTEIHTPLAKVVN